MHNARIFLIKTYQKSTKNLVHVDKKTVPPQKERSIFSRIPVLNEPVQLLLGFNHDAAAADALLILLGKKVQLHIQNAVGFLALLTVERKSAVKFPQNKAVMLLCRP